MVCRYKHIMRPALFAIWYDETLRKRLLRDKVLGSASFPRTVEQYAEALLQQHRERQVPYFLVVFRWAVEAVL